MTGPAAGLIDDALAAPETAAGEPVVQFDRQLRVREIGKHHLFRATRDIGTWCGPRHVEIGQGSGLEQFHLNPSQVLLTAPRNQNTMTGS